MLNTMMENKNTQVLLLFIKSCVFTSHHSLQHGEASGFTFYNEVDCPNSYIWIFFNFLIFSIFPILIFQFVRICYFCDLLGTRYQFKAYQLFF